MNDIELFDKPGIIITNDAVYKTTKVKKWIKKNNPKEYSIKYLDIDTSNFKEVEYQLQKMVNDINGISTKKEKIDPESVGQEKIPLIYLYIIDGPYNCKYITAGNLLYLNDALRHYSWPELTQNDLEAIDKNIIIKNKYIISDSKDGLQEKIQILKKQYGL